MAIIGELRLCPLAVSAGGIIASGHPPAFFGGGQLGNLAIGRNGHLLRRRWRIGEPIRPANG